MRLHDGASKEEDDGNYEDIKETMKQIALSKAKKEIFDEKDERERKL